MNKTKNFILYILALLLIISVFFNIQNMLQQQKGYMRIISDTTRITIIDTVQYSQPVPVDSVVTKYETIYIRKYDENINKDTSSVDTLAPIADSIKIEIPITQKIYADSTYTAYVSGYHPTLDSIAIYNSIVTIREKEQTIKQSRIGFGLICGGGYGIKGFSPYIGIGFFCKIGK